MVMDMWTWTWTWTWTWAWASPNVFVAIDASCCHIQPLRSRECSWRICCVHTIIGDEDGDGKLTLLELRSKLRHDTKALSGLTPQEKHARQRIRKHCITQYEIRRSESPEPPQQPQRFQSASKQHTAKGESSRIAEHQKHRAFAKEVQKARVSFVSNALGVGQETSKDLLSLAAESAARDTAMTSGKQQKSGPLLSRTESFSVQDPTRELSETEDTEETWLDVHNQSARAAAHLIEILRDKGRENGGSVTRRQFTEVLQDLGVELGVHDALFNSLDTDHSGTIDLRELKAAISLILDPGANMSFESLIMANGSMLRGPIERLRDRLAAQASRVIDLFRRWDLDGNGYISMNEFRCMLPELGFSGCLPWEVEELFNDFDIDRSGRISFRELHRMLRKSPSPTQVSPSVRQLVTAGPGMPVLDIDALRQQMKKEVLKLGVTAELRSALRSEDEWKRLGFGQQAGAQAGAQAGLPEGKLGEGEEEDEELQQYLRPPMVRIGSQG